MDLAAEIIPAKSLGGIDLRDRLSKYSGYLEKSNIMGLLNYKQVGVYSTRYSFKNYPVEFNVDTRTGLIYKISAINKYEGRFDKLIGIGFPVKNIFQLNMGFYYDDCDEAIYSNKVEGLTLELNADDPLPEEIGDLKVSVISVFSPELFP